MNIQKKKKEILYEVYKGLVYLGENIRKRNNWQGIDLQNIQTAHAPQ